MSRRGAGMRWGAATGGKEEGTHTPLSSTSSGRPRFRWSYCCSPALRSASLHTHGLQQFQINRRSSTFAIHASRSAPPLPSPAPAQHAQSRLAKLRTLASSSPSSQQCPTRGARYSVTEVAGQQRCAPASSYFARPSHYAEENAGAPGLCLPAGTTSRRPAAGSGLRTRT